MKQYLGALVLSVLWVTLSMIFAFPWISDISAVLGPILAWAIVLGMALIPGAAIAFTYGTVMFDRRHKRRDEDKPILTLEDVTILIAAYNEEDVIYGTLSSLLKQTYRGRMDVIICNDGSTDGTREKIQEFITDSGWSAIRVVNSPINVGKANVLNLGLKKAQSKNIITIDADTILEPTAVASILTTLEHTTDDVVAVAGTVLVKNGSASWISRLQEWDYLIGISAIKQAQSAYENTLVAQGAFSAYYRDNLIEILGWPDMVGEDIVLSWKFLEKGYRISHDQNAIAYTRVPETYGQFFKQRKRWSTGLIEAFKESPKMLYPNKKGAIFVYYNALFPFLDFCFMFVFVPSIILALFFHYYLLVGLITLLILPLGLSVASLMFFRQKGILKRSGLKMPMSNWWGGILFFAGFQFLQVPATLAGYTTGIFNLRKSWGTK